MEALSFHAKECELGSCKWWNVTSWFQLIGIFLSLFFFSFCFVLVLVFCLFRAVPYLWHMEVPRLGVKSELQLPAYTLAIAAWDQVTSETCTTTQGNTESLIHWAKPRIKPAFSWILARFITAEPQQELPEISFEGTMVNWFEWLPYWPTLKVGL